MSKEAYMSVSWGKRKTKLDKSTILYAIANRKYVEVHVRRERAWGCILFNVDEMK